MIHFKIIKLLISLGMVSTLGLGTVYGTSKITNKVKDPQAVEVKSPEESHKVEENKKVGQVNDDSNAKTEKVEIAQSNEKQTEEAKQNSNTKNEPNGSVANPSKETSVNEAQQPKAEEAKTEAPSANQDDSYISEIEQLIFQQVNQQRQAAGLQPLSYNSTMEHYARVKSKDMGVRRYFDHTNPEGQLITAQMKADGVSYNAWGENIAYIGGVSGNSNLANQFMTNWMNSPGHRANILSSNFTSIGVGVYKIGNKYYATQEFYR